MLATEQQLDVDKISQQIEARVRASLQTALTKVSEDNQKTLDAVRKEVNTTFEQLNKKNQAQDDRVEALEKRVTDAISQAVAGEFQNQARQLGLKNWFELVAPERQQLFVELLDNVPSSLRGKTASEAQLALYKSSDAMVSLMNFSGKPVAYHHLSTLKASMYIAGAVAAGGGLTATGLALWGKHKLKKAGYTVQDQRDWLNREGAYASSPAALPADTSAPNPFMDSMASSRAA